MSDRNSGEREIPVEILEKREFRCWSGDDVFGKIPVLVRHWFKKMFHVPFRSGFGLIVDFEKKNMGVKSVL